MFRIDSFSFMLKHYRNQQNRVKGTNSKVTNLKNSAYKEENPNKGK